MSILSGIFCGLMYILMWAVTAFLFNRRIGIKDKFACISIGVVWPVTIIYLIIDLCVTLMACIAAYTVIPLFKFLANKWEKLDKWLDKRKK